MAAVGVRLMPVDVHHRKIGLQREFLVEAALPPFSVALDPVARGLHPVLPAPAFGRPESAAPIAAVANEFQKSRIRDRSPGNAKGLQLDSVLPLFVVEMKSGVSCRTEEKLSPGSSTSPSRAPFPALCRSSGSA